MKDHQFQNPREWLLPVEENCLDPLLSIDEILDRFSNDTGIRGAADVLLVMGNAWYNFDDADRAQTFAAICARQAVAQSKIPEETRLERKIQYHRNQAKRFLRTEREAEGEGETEEMQSVETEE